MKLALPAVLWLTRGDEAARAPSERFVLAKASTLEPYDLHDLLRYDWLPASSRTVEMARLRLAQARDPNINDRFNDREERELTALLACGPGLAELAATDLVNAAVELGPDYPLLGAEFAEVAWRAGRARDAVKVLDAMLAATPDQPVYGTRRAFLQSMRAAAELDAAGQWSPESSAQVEAAAQAARDLANPADREPDDYRIRFARQISASVTARALLAGTDPPAVPAVLEPDIEADGQRASDPRDADPADMLRARAQALIAMAGSLRSQAQRLTPTATYVRAFADLCLITAHLIRFDAAEFDADGTADAHRTAAQRRAADLTDRLTAELGADDPLAAPVLAGLTQAQEVTTGEQAEALARSWAALPVPLMTVNGPARQALPPLGQDTRPDPERPPVAVVLASVDGLLVTGPQVLRPANAYTLLLDVRIPGWPDWAERLDAELLSHFTQAEAQTPAFTWTRPHNAAPRTPIQLTAEGTLLLRFSLAAGRPAPPFRVALRFRGEHDGEPTVQLCDVAGHAELRFRPFDASRDALTQYPVIDERLLILYERLHGAGYDEDQVQAFCRLLTATCRAGMSMTWEKRYRRGQRVTERQFHDDLHNRLLHDPELGGRVERGTPSALGFLDVRHDGITAELKVERKTPVTRQIAPKYMGQPTQYAAADGARLSILCILDMSPKASPVGTAENYIWQIEPALHGLTNPEAPSLVTIVVVNGNLPPPSNWSRRRIATRQGDPA